jgi:hypothetical protein
MNTRIQESRRSFPRRALLAIAAAAAFTASFAMTVSAQSDPWCEYALRKCLDRYNGCLQIRDQAYCEPRYVACVLDSGCEG